MPRRYTATQGSASSATAATADHVSALLWNPSSTMRLFVREVRIVQQSSSVGNVGLVRASTAGATPFSSVTPDADADADRELAPPSGAIIYLGAFGTQPTLQKPYMYLGNWVGLTGGQGLSLEWMFPEEPIEVPEGTGLAVATPVAVVLNTALYEFVWEER